MNWALSSHCDKAVLPLADRHYSRRKPGSPQFTPPGRKIVFKTEAVDALWVTSWPFGRYVQHRWAHMEMWTCSLFRNEGSLLSSQLILEALAATRYMWSVLPSWSCQPEPEAGMLTFVDPRKVRSRNPGCCFKKAGFLYIGDSKSGFMGFQMKLADMPSATPPREM